MDHVKMKKEEIKGEVVHTFGFAYQNKAQEIKWVDDILVATKRKDDSWTYSINNVKDLSQEQFQTFGSLLGKITQVVDTNGMNLAGIKVVKDEPVAKAK